MMFDIILAILFVGSIGVVWYRISERIPELVAIPDEVIVERLHEDSARIRVFVLNLKLWWREKQYREPLWRICEKIVYRLHIFLMRADNGTVGLLKKVRMLGGLPNGNGNGNGSGKEPYAQAVAPEAQFTAVAASTMLPFPRSTRIQEVRPKKKEAMPG